MATDRAGADFCGAVYMPGSALREHEGAALAAPPWGGEPAWGTATAVVGARHPPGEQGPENSFFTQTIYK